MGVIDSPGSHRQYSCCCELPHLTPRHLDVLEAIANRMTSREAALALNLSPATVDSHITRMMAMARVTRRKDLVDTALSQGILSARFPHNRTGRTCLHPYL